MADLAAALDALANPGRAGGTPCSVEVYLSGLRGRDVALHARVVGLVDDHAVQASALARALEVDGARLTAPSLLRHRRRGESAGCKCPR